MGVWDCRCVPPTCSGLYGSGVSSGCCHAASLQAHTAARSTVHSDDWAAYRQVQQLSNVSTHNVVNHSLRFVDPGTGVHAQNIESYWNRVKTKLKRMRGCHSHQLSRYLDEFLWRERYGKTGGEAWNSILVDVAAQYPV